MAGLLSTAGLLSEDSDSNCDGHVNKDEDIGSPVPWRRSTARVELSQLCRVFVSLLMPGSGYYKNQNLVAN